MPSRVSHYIALLTETQQLDDRIRFVIKQLKLPIREPNQVAAPKGDEAAVAELAGEEDVPGVPPRMMRRGMARGKTKQEWMEYLATMAPADPSGDKGKHLQWIAKQVLSGNLIFPEDIDKTKEELAKFDQMTKSPKFDGDHNVLSYDSFAALHDAVLKNTKTESNISKEDHLFGLEGVSVIAGPIPVRDIVYDKVKKAKVDRGPLGEARVVKVMSAEAGGKLFRRGGATWCVKDPRFFSGSSYAPPYFMIELKKPGSEEFFPVYLHDRKSLSLMRANDQAANLDDMRPYGELLKQAGLLDDKRGLQYVLTNGASVKESQPLAYLSVIMSDDRDIKAQAVAYIEQQVSKIRNRKAT